MNNPGESSSTEKPPIRSWRLQLSLLQVSVLLGIVMGSMVCAFFLGFLSGRAAGLEGALASTASHLAKLPIMPPLGTEEEAIDAEKEVYENLNKEKKLSPPEEPSTVGVKTPDEGLSGIQKVEIGESELPPSQRKDTENLFGDDEQVEPVPTASKAKTASTLGELIEEEKRKNIIEESEADKRLSEAVSRIGDAEKRTPTAVPTLQLRLKTEEKKAATPSPKQSSSTPQNEGDIRTSSTPPRGWFAQVVAPKTASDAAGVAKKLRAAGFPVFIEKTEIKGELYYRVLVGPETNRELADRLADQVKRESFIKSPPFVRQIK
jgi:cell division septation protein DedD